MENGLPEHVGGQHEPVLHVVHGTSQRWAEIT